VGSIPSAVAPRRPPTIGLKYESGTGIITMMLTTPSRSAPTITTLAQRRDMSSR
jgi:hypothetical protein